MSEINFRKLIRGTHRVCAVGTDLKMNPAKRKPRRLVCADATPIPLRLPHAHRTSPRWRANAARGRVARRCGVGEGWRG